MLFLSKFYDFWKEQFREAFGGSIGDTVNESLNPKLVNFFGLQVDPAIYTTFIVAGIIIILSLLIRIFLIPKFKKRPKGLQLMIENFVMYFDKSTKEAIHKNVSFVGPYVCVAALYIGLATLIELLGVRPAFASINACLAMGFMTFIVINICAIKEKKLKRIRRYVPNVLNIVTDGAVPFSLGLRLFGSILSGYIIMEVLYTAVYTSFGIPAIVALLTTILHAFLQAYLFATLTNIFIGEATE